MAKLQNFNKSQVFKNMILNLWNFKSFLIIYREILYTYKKRNIFLCIIYIIFLHI